MLPKPKHLGPEYAAQFKDAGVVAAYHHRPPYPDEAFTVLLELLAGQPRTVLDVGCGTGEIARVLVEHVERVDAVDFSQGMIDKGRLLPGGDNPRLNWICASVEEAPLDGPYGLITAGASLHWMDWAVVFPRFKAALAPGAYLALVYEGTLPNPWDRELQCIIDRYSTNRDYVPYNTLEELEQRQLFHKVGEHRAATVPFAQPVEAYIESFHARNGLSRDRMGDSALRFDEAVRAVVSGYSEADTVRLEVFATVTWGGPAGAY